MNSEEHSPEKMQRLFVALELPDDVRESLTALQQGLSGMRWTAPNNLHLTLRFIGEVPLTQVEKIRRALEDIQEKSFSLRLCELGFFDRKPQAVLWAGLDASQSLLMLKNRVDAALAKHAELPLPQERFSPHITLGRMKNADREILKEFTAQHIAASKTPFLVTGFTLFSSILDSSGAEYTVEARYTLTCEQPDGQ